MPAISYEESEYYRAIQHKSGPSYQHKAIGLPVMEQRAAARKQAPAKPVAKPRTATTDRDRRLELLELEVSLMGIE